MAGGGSGFLSQSIQGVDNNEFGTEINRCAFSLAFIYTIIYFII